MTKPKANKANPAKRGQQTALTPQVHKAICNSLRRGVWLAHAAEGAGVSREVVNEWVRIGKGYQRDKETRQWKRVTNVGPEPFASFAKAVTKAKASAGSREQIKISNAPDWRAAAWLLERRDPKVFGDRLRLEVNTKLQQSLDSFLKDLEHGVSPGAYAEVVSFVARRMGVQSSGGAGTGEAG